MTNKKDYNKRTWLNDIKSSSTSSIVCFDGEVEYGDKTYRDTFVKISDCKYSIKLHKKDGENTDSFISKLRLLQDEIELFINHLE
jgi:hypothetical protein